MIQYHIVSLYRILQKNLSKLLNRALPEGVYLYTWLKGTANKIPIGLSGGDWTGKTINQNGGNKIIHEPESKKGFRRF